MLRENTRHIILKIKDIVFYSHYQYCLIATHLRTAQVALDKNHC